ncbi:MAG: phosphoadenosine phosphosulfate reductase [Candidatus Thorarchaeota archaeon]|nr:phosphoadenosine phosphosulfate reductase [Candidatus Thorarchaeota archaeon]
MTKRKKPHRRFRRGHAPYLTKIRFYWCDTCNVPRISPTKCNICGTPSREVDISPPGDPFPAMDGHLAQARTAIDAQFGDGVGPALLPIDTTIVLNKIPSLDTMFEVIAGGQIIGRLRFEIPTHQYVFLLTLEGAKRIGHLSKQKWVSMKEGVLKYLLDGANLMLPGIAGCDSGIEENDEVWVINSDGDVVAVGIARMNGRKMAKATKGFAVKIREVAEPSKSLVIQTPSSWDKAVIANEDGLQEIEHEAVSFIKRTAEKGDFPVVVGFSGGKDSLATYLLVEKALGFSPPLFFVDTGLELPETIDYIHSFAEERAARILGQESGNQYWESIASFGPPARDFRWCCKILKLGPAATSISEQMGGSSLSFMGQRRLESFQRSIEPRVTSNPWVPGQTSANPIRNWNALEVWLYIFREKSSFNPSYNKGYHRMGCYLCPSSPLSEFESLKSTHPELYERWASSMYSWADRFGFPKEWVDFGFWRWKRIPQGQMKLAQKLGIDIAPDRPGPADELKLTITKGVAPCTSAGYSIEGQFPSGLDLERIAELLPIFGKTRCSEELGALRSTSGSSSILIFSSGSLVVRGDDEKEVESLAEQVERTIRRAMLCQACGSCVPQCPQNALSLELGKISVNQNKCVNCLECNSWPCPTYLS